MSSYVLIWSIIKIAIVLLFLLQLAAILSWMERRQSAMMQDRFGPNRAEITLFGKKIRLAGLLHPLADAVKMIFKEDFIPPNADKVLHALAPILAMFPPLVVMAVMPFADTLCLDSLREYTPAGPGQIHVQWHLLSDWTDANGILHTAWAGRWGTCSNMVAPGHLPGIEMQVASLNVGLLYIFALAGMGIIGATIAGWSSDNKFSLLGGLRAASQLVSYEVAMGLSLVGAMMIYGTVRLGDMARWQDEHTWGIFVQPLGALLFFVAAVAETKRAPFDLPEGESEIVAGYFLEYSGMKFGMFFTGEFIEVATSSAFFAAVFLGGYNLPFLHRDGITVAIGDALLWQRHIPHIFVILIQTATFFGKVVFLCWFQMFVRWTLPRFRYDQLMKLGWRMLLPAALANVFLTGVLVLAVERASYDTLDQLQAVADVCNAVVAIAMIVGFVMIVFGLFTPTQREERRHAFKRAVQKRLQKAETAEAA
jgi:NADH-quinone oxidoreductase subunit H